MSTVKIPPIVRKLFEQFPFKTLPTIDKPSHDNINSKELVLYVYRAFHDDLVIDPRCLQASILLKLTGENFKIIESSSSSSENNRLPLLIEPGNRGQKNVYTTCQAIINRWNKSPWINAEVKVFQTFVENSLNDFWVFLLFLTPECSEFVNQVYLTANEQELLPTVIQNAIFKDIRTAQLQELQPRYSEMVNRMNSWVSLGSNPIIEATKQDILDRTKECVEVITQLIGKNDTDFVPIGSRINDESPLGLVDVLVFSYIYPIRLILRQIGKDDLIDIVEPLYHHQEQVRLALSKS